MSASAEGLSRRSCVWLVCVTLVFPCVLSYLTMVHFSDSNYVLMFQRMIVATVVVWFLAPRAVAAGAPRLIWLAVFVGLLPDSAVYLLDYGFSFDALWAAVFASAAVPALVTWWRARRCAPVSQATACRSCSETPGTALVAVAAGSEGWFYSVGSQLFGPVSADELRPMTTSGELAPDTLVWTAGMPDWRPASLVLTERQHPASALERPREKTIVKVLAVCAVLVIVLYPIAMGAYWIVLTEQDRVPEPTVEELVANYDRSQSSFRRIVELVPADGEHYYYTTNRLDEPRRTLLPPAFRAPMQTIGAKSLNTWDEEIDLSLGANGISVSGVEWGYWHTDSPEGLPGDVVTLDETRGFSESLHWFYPLGDGWYAYKHSF